MAVVLLAAMLLAGCTGVPDAGPTGSAPPAPATLEPGEEVVPTATPQLRPDGTAVQNLQYFEASLQGYIAANGLGTSQQLADWMTSAGFDRAALELTDWRTPTGTNEVSIDVGLRFGEDCLVGTVRADRVTANVAEPVETGACLLGENWLDR